MIPATSPVGAAPDDDRLDHYDYPLADVRIAATPSAERDGARLLVHAAGATTHSHFRDLATFLRKGDLLVLNDTRVLPARLHARRASGGEVELLLHPTGLDPATAQPALFARPDGRADAGDVVLALVKPSARVRAGEVLTLVRPPGVDDDARSLEVVVVDPPGGDLRRVRLVGGLERALELGELPLPPYIERETTHDEERARLFALDRERYQTVFARAPGAIAAPTAGLHFTPPLLQSLAAAGIGAAHVTLHVGPGTFLPVRSELLSQHAMHEELYDVSVEAARAIEATRQRGGRIVAVGTTTTRALESAAAGDGVVRPGRARTRLMIRPPHRFRAIDALITNFHLPKTTLLALVAARVGRERLLALYREAATRGYRFYSYGDAMLLT